MKGVIEDEEDFRVLLGLDESDFSSTYDYIATFYKIMKKLHKDDKINEEARKESLGNIFHTQNLHPTAFRSPFSPSSCHIKALVPVLCETFEAVFDGAKRPVYRKVGEKWLQQKSIFGVITG